jgi:hypothetical protein
VKNLKAVKTVNTNPINRRTIPVVFMTKILEDAGKHGKANDKSITGLSKNLRYREPEYLLIFI